MNAFKKVMARLLAGVSVPAQVLIFPALTNIAAAAGNTSANAGDWGNFDVGSRVVHVELKGTAKERRPMDVLLWHPADKKCYASATPTVYASRLNGIPIIHPTLPDTWVPMSFVVPAERARRCVLVDQGGPSFPLIVYTHPAMSDPQNPAYTLERLASHGFIIAAPWHNGDTQDDQRIDVINQRAGKKILQCFDGGASPCLDGLNKALQNRALDLSALLDVVPSIFGDRVDMDKIGVLGQSRGSLTALASAGGSTPLNIKPEPRIKAIMTMTIGMRTATFSVDLANVKLPALMVTSKADRNADMSIAVDAFNTISSEEKALVVLERGEHAVYSSNRCAQMQAAGAVFQDHPKAIGEQLTLENMLLSANSGTPIDYCNFASFTQPVDIRPTVFAITGYAVTETNVPRMLDTVTAMRLVLEFANTFFDATLVKQAQPGVHFKQYLSPKFELRKEGQAVSYEEAQSIKGRAVECDDSELLLDPACSEG
jgi:predicted dienelactone hydrolase